MNAFVCGTVDEIEKLANDLANACDTVRYCIEAEGEGTDFEIRYDNSDKRIRISYYGTGKRTEETKEVEKEIERIKEEVKEDKKSIREVDGFDWDEE